MKVKFTRDGFYPEMHTRAHMQQAVFNSLSAVTSEEWVERAEWRQAVAHSLASGVQEQERREAEPQGTASQQWDSWHTEVGPQNLRRPLDTWHVGIDTPQEGDWQQLDKNGQNKVQLDQHSAATVLFDQWLMEWEVESDPHCNQASQALTEEQVLFDQWLTEWKGDLISDHLSHTWSLREEIRC